MRNLKISPYIALMKLRVVELLLVTTLPALFLAAKGVPPLGLTIATLIGGTLAAGASNAFNMIIEVCTKSTQDAVEKGAAIGHAIGNGMQLTKDLGNLPGNICTPNYLAETAKALAKQYKLGIEVLDHKKMEELNRTILQAANVPNLDKIMPKKPDTMPLDPVSDILAAVKGMPIQAFVGQNHDAHIATKTAYIQDPMNGGNPAMQRIVPVLQANIQEHMILKYQEQLGGMVGQAEEQATMSGQEIDEKTAEMIMAQAAQQIAQTNQILAQQGMNITPEQQMVQLEGQRLSIEQQKLQAQLAKEQAAAALKNRELGLKEMKLAVDAYSNGASQILKSDEKEKDRNAKKAMKAVEIFADLLKQEEELTNDRILKAADIVTELAKAEDI